MADTKQTCWFSASDPVAILIGGIFPTKPADAKPIAEVQVQGVCSTPFKLPTGSYRYEFNIVASTSFTLELFVDGVKRKCAPAKFATAQGGSIDRVTLFTIP